MKFDGLKNKIRKVATVLAAAIGIGAIGTAGAIGGVKEEVKAAEESVFRFEIQVPDEYLKGGAKQNSEFLFAFNLNGGGWQEVNGVTKTTVLNYDVYSPTAVPGVGFFSAQEGAGDWFFLSNNFQASYPASGGMVDEQGVSVHTTADLSPYISNGWFTRRITMTAFANTTKLAHAVVGVHKAADVVWDQADLIDGNKIVVYYKNLYYNVGGSIVSPLASGVVPDTGITADNFTGHQKNGDVLNGYLGWQSMSPFEEGTTTVKSSIKLTAGTGDFSGVDVATAPQDGGVGAEIDFTGIKDTSGNLIKDKAGFSVTVNGKEAVGGKYTLTVEDVGSIPVKVTFGTGDKKMSCTYTATIVRNLNQYTFKESDFDVIPRETDSMTDVELPAIKAYVQGQAVVEPQISVTTDGKAVELTDGENGAKTFRPVSSGDQANGYKTTYTVTYKAIDPQDSENVAEFVFEIVSDWVKDPVIDLTKLPLNKNADGDYRIDTYGSEVALPKSVAANDYSDGATDEFVDANLVKVLDPFGREVSLKENGNEYTFRANVSTDNSIGNWYQIVYRATNDKGFTAEKSTTMQVGHDVGTALHWRVYTGKNEQGTAKATSVSLYQWFKDLYRFLPGDKLVYDMYVPSGIDGVMLDFEYENTWGIMSKHTASDGTAYFDLADENGVKMNVTPEAATTGWATRSFVLPNEILTDKNGDNTSNYITHLLLTLNTTDAIDAEYVDVYFRNIKIVNQSGLETMLYDGLHALKPAHKRNAEAGREQFTNLSYLVFSAVNPIPSIDEGKFAEKYGTKEAVDLPEDAYFDFYKNDALTDVEITVSDPEGAAVTLDENHAFFATKAGRYTVRYKDNVSNAFAEIEILVTDDTLPVLTPSAEIAATATAGDKITLPTFTASDNITAADKLTVSVTVNFTDADGNKSRIEVAEDNTFVASKAGTYVVTAVVRDQAGNRTSWEHKIEVAAKKGGCGASVSISFVLALTTVAAGAFVLRSRKENA